MYSKMHRFGLPGGAPSTMRIPSSSTITILPAGISSTSWAPMVCRAQLSEATTQPPFSRPRERGRKPHGSRTA